MKLSAPQAYDIEKALIRGRVIDAVAIYRTATGTGLAEAKAEVEKIKHKLQQEKPWYFKNAVEDPPGIQSEKRSLGASALIVFLIVDVLIVGAIIFFFVLDKGDGAASQATAFGVDQRSDNSSSEARPKILRLPEVSDDASYLTVLSTEETFRSLYEAKISSPEYIQRKRTSSSRDYDPGVLETKIKTARSNRAAARVAPTDISPLLIATVGKDPAIDGVINPDEWRDATRLDISGEDTRLYLQVRGPWLFVACDAPAELTANGYDQLRLYFHSGLLKKLVNERIHVGRGPGVTSIRQTRFRWQGEPSQSNEERWQRYKISDWGIYQYAVATSSMAVGHRQYEAAIHLGEAGLHRQTPFTFYAEIETDPLKNQQGQFVERRYLGQLGSKENPLWLMY